MNGNIRLETRHNSKFVRGLANYPKHSNFGTLQAEGHLKRRETPPSRLQENGQL